MPDLSTCPHCGGGGICKKGGYFIQYKNIPISSAAEAVRLVLADTDWRAKKGSCSTCVSIARKRGDPLEPVRTRQEAPSRGIAHCHMCRGHGQVIINAEGVCVPLKAG